MGVGVRDLSAFAPQLKELYETLEGAAVIEEQYGTSFIRFSASSRGHIRVWSRINNKNTYGFTQELKFDNEVDQTYLREFARALFTDFGKDAV